MSVNKSLLFLATLFTGCSSSLYHPPHMHVPLHTHTAEAAIAAYAGIGDHAGERFGLDGSYSIADNIAIQVGGMTSSRDEWASQRSLQVGLGGFQVGHDSNFSIGGWALYGRGSNTEVFFQGDQVTDFNKFALQAEAGIVEENLEVFAGLRYVMFSAPETEYKHGEYGQYIEPSFGMRLGFTNFKFEGQLLLSKRTDIATENGGLVTVGVMTKL